MVTLDGIAAVTADGEAIGAAPTKLQRTRVIVVYLVAIDSEANTLGAPIVGTIDGIENWGLGVRAGAWSRSRGGTDCYGYKGGLARSNGEVFSGIIFGVGSHNTIVASA